MSATWLRCQGRDTNAIYVVRVAVIDAIVREGIGLGAWRLTVTGPESSEELEVLVGDDDQDALLGRPADRAAELAELLRTADHDGVLSVEIDEHGRLAATVYRP